MLQDFVNDLPTELFYQVFGYLDSKERQTVAEVCKRWFDILSSERYPQTLELEPHNHDELDVDLSVKNWHNIFGYNEEFYFPKLRKITFRHLLSGDENILLRPFLPSWIKHQRKSTTPKRMLSEQIETLVIEYSPSLVLPEAELFPNLRSLTLFRIHRVTFEDSLRIITRRLTELKILKVDSLNFLNILHNARGLESLSISGDLPMSADAYEAINNMNTLKWLSLTIPIDKGAKGLSLPFLKTLTISYDGLIPLEDVPNLRSLRIDADPYGNYSGINENIVVYYRLFGHQLRHMTVMNLFLNKVHVTQICTLSNLQTLKMRNCDMEFADVEKICQSIGSLKLLRLKYCTVASELILCIKHSGCACKCKWCMGIINIHEIEQWEELITCFSNLRAQFVDCAITADDYVLKQYSLVNTSFR